MRRRQMIVAASLAAILSACSSETPPAAEPVVKKLRVGYSGEIDFGDLPSVMAQQRLRDQGYDVERIHFSAPDILVDAATRGSVDAIHTTNILVWTAIARGANLMTVMSNVANAYRLVVTSDITKCTDLDGRRVATSVESSLSTQLFLTYVREECPEVEPQLLNIPSLPNRAGAFVSGGLDASPIDLGTFLWLQQQSPGRFSVLSNFLQRWPRLKTSGVHVNTDFAAAQPDTLVAYLAAMLGVIRDVNRNPALLVSAANEYMGSTTDWQPVARAYLDDEMWLTDGGLTTGDIEASLAFFQSNTQLDPDLTPDLVADLSFLERARKEQGE